MSRIDTGSKVIKASPQTIYRAFVEPAALAKWRPPKGMRAEIHRFEPRAGGEFRMSFIHADDSVGRGKTTAKADTFHGRFAELVPGERIVEVVEFESDDPAFAGEMTIRTILHPVPNGTEVTVAAENVPPGISAEDHRAGIASSLANLAAFAEARS